MTCHLCCPCQFPCSPIYRFLFFLTFFPLGSVATFASPTAEANLGCSNEVSYHKVHHNSTSFAMLGRILLELRCPFIDYTLNLFLL